MASEGRCTFQSVPWFTIPLCLIFCIHGVSSIITDITSRLFQFLFISKRLGFRVQFHVTIRVLWWQLLPEWVALCFLILCLQHKQKNLQIHISAMLSSIGVLHLQNKLMQH